MSSRRAFLNRLAWVAPAAGLAQAAPAVGPAPNHRISLDGIWDFRLDSGADWKPVSVPHTWQTAPASSGVYGVAWYRRVIDVPREWQGAAVRIEFEAVFHSAVVQVNGRPAGEHLRKGYTAFTIDLAPFLNFGAPNTILVRVENTFDDRMLPRGDSSDWAHDGGIYRPVSLLVTPPDYIERLDVTATPDPSAPRAAIHIDAILHGRGEARVTVTEEDTGRAVLEGAAPLHATLENPRLWHFDHPHLYRAVARLANGHTCETTFGIRRIEVRGGGFYLNGERVRLMGVERMAGSNPEYGMAEPAHWIAHDHADMKELNCVYTRVHWPQDRRVLDYCDRHGILIQTEVPTWGPDTFREPGPEPNSEILENGLQQLREMIARDRNHPCIFSWGVCNEINGQNPPAAAFARRMYQEAKKLDPSRLVTYASNSLQQNPGRDIAGHMDYIMWNEYYGSWYKGTPQDLARNLDEIHRAFPDKPIVISEYGYCACTADRPEGDGERVEILRAHDAVLRRSESIAGLIFFCYNDYRTHVGDKGAGVMKQRVHGVVDVYGARKPSWQALRDESSPVEPIEVSGRIGELKIKVRCRRDVPAYTLRGYKVRAVVYGFGDVPLERPEAPLPVLEPGQQTEATLRFEEKLPREVRIDVIRPTGYSARSVTWKP
ncbi:MAG: glycoside hydrolase family 2 TIM barrel-domain containing protein [Bryobacteraceae bacterium]